MQTPPLKSSQNNLSNGGQVPSKHYTNRNNHIFILTALPNILYFMSRKSWIFLLNFLSFCQGYRSKILSQALSCRKFPMNTASTNIYFEFFKITGFTRTRVYCVILGQWGATLAGWREFTRILTCRIHFWHLQRHTIQTWHCFDVFN
jgi:hypothetical protein